MTERELQAYEDGRQIVRTLTQSANSTRETRQLIDGMMHEWYDTHRTCQQGIIRILAMWISRWASLCKQERACHVDLRNEAAADWAQQVARLGVYMPTI